MAFDVQTLVSASNCADCLSPNQKLNAALYLLNSIFEGGGSGGIVLHNLLSATHPDTVPGPPTRGALVVGNATPDWESLPIGAANRVLRSDGVDATWSQLVLTTDVTGILPIANGGTNSGAALNNNRIMVSSGGAIVEAAALTNGQLLIGSTGAAPVAASLTAGANITITPGSGSITIAATGVVTQAYSTIQEEGAALPQQSILNFISAALTAADDPGNSRTNVTLAHSALTRVDDTNVTLTLGGSPTTALLAATSLTLGWTGTLSPARGGTGTGTVFTQGSVIFAGAAGVYSEDNANFFWDDTNNRLGIGTAAPAGLLELSSNAFPSNNALIITLGNDTGTNFPNIFYRRSRGTVALPTAVLTNDRLGGFGFRGYGTTGFFTADNAVFRVFAAENFTNTEQGTYFTFESTPIGSLTRLERMRIDTFSISMSPTGTAAGRTNELRFLELAANGTNYTGFRASDAMAASEIYVLPNAAPAANRFLQAAAVAGGVSALSWAQVSLTADVTGILPVANGGSGTSTAFTQGSVIFAGAAGVFSQDNANFFWDDANNFLGIGIAVPAATLHLNGTSAMSEILISGIVASSGFAFGNVVNTNVSSTGSHVYGWYNSPTLTPPDTKVADNFALAGTVVAGAGLTLLRAVQLDIGIIVKSGTGTITDCYGVYIQSQSAGTNNYGIYQLGTNSNYFAGSVGIGVITPLAKFHVTNSAAATVATIIKAAAAQSANLTEWQSSAAVVMASIGPAGNPFFPALTRVGSQVAGTGLVIGSQTAGLSSLGSDVGLDLIATGNATFSAFNFINESTGSSAGLSMQWILANSAGTKKRAGRFEFRKSADWASAANEDTEFLLRLLDGGVDTERLRISSDGKIGIMPLGATTATLHIRGGTTAATTAPLKFESGVLMTTPELGAFEYVADDLYFTIFTGTARKRFLFADPSGGLTSGKIPVATTNGRLTDLTASSAYTPTNVTTDRSYDANATSVDELADVLGSVIADLQTKGILG